MINRVLLVLFFFISLIPTLTLAKQTASKQRAEQSVVMISLDGFRWDYIEKHKAKNLASIAAQGVRAEYLEPVYPTKTFPNHLSIITGLLPSNHGIVGNHFCDSARDQCYRMGRGQDDSSWLKGIPLWNLAEMQGLKAATYFWPESDARINGMTPSYFYHYSKHSDYQQRIDQIVQWLKLPAQTRPRFVAGYFSLVDTMGHEFGPDAQQTYQAVQKVDKLIGQLARRIQREVEQDVNLIIVSDHGMAQLDPEQRLLLSDLSVELSDFIVKNSGTQVWLYKKPKATLDLDEVRAQLMRNARGRYHITSEATLKSRGVTIDSTTADIVIETQAPRYFAYDDKDKHYGTHGFAVTPDMHATFVAVGPAFKQGVEIGPVKNLDIYPVVAQILGLDLLSDIDGTGASLLPALRH
ncbi:alkaline phosphatase family protein [Pseudoalteromonas rubra]|uniref:Alkaline phosphatase family protein n=1 Tax=Pseudoalteromonas rubra TaxID=43658 RepID=A0A4Q7E0F2_9GAMM|nr:ectonucleotide pyrophosphatase/phosphodiesterase [Pseudoalteromonas rubra]RZM74823.1 alkaline phosphatase family protein [Pseudoalteromonas rubra]